MSLDAFFEAEFDLEESVRVDRRASEGSRAEQLRLLRNYHVTASAEHYLRDLLARILGEAEGEREGFNHWLYGYYGSGKSHLLAVTGLLLDSEWVASVGREEAWTALSGRSDALGDLRKLWERCLEEYRLYPLFINLLKEQGSQKRGFGNVILRRLHEEQGRSPHLETAFFEKWYAGRNSEEKLREDAEKVLRDMTEGLPEGDLWERVQKYQVLAKGALPALFEKEMGTTDGLSDVTDRSLGASEVARRIEEARQNLIEEDPGDDRPVRLLLLLDEITLFIDTQYELLTELNVLAEEIDEKGDGNVLTIGTAQEDPSRVQTEYSAREVDFSILDDRFPHKYSLPSSHVGEIAQNRLLRKTGDGKEAFGDALRESQLSPANSLVFYDVQKNTNPPLDHLPEEEVKAYLPLLPYQPPLFLDILSNLRTKETEQAKSIFSGTARAVLSIVEALVQRWERGESSPEEEDESRSGGDPTRIVSLVDFFEVIRPELEEIVPRETGTIEEVESRVEDGDLKPIDAKVCKVVLLLQRVPDMIPLDKAKNIAVGLMDDLNGNTLHRMANAVDKSLGRLGKYIRTDDESPSHLRFTDREEREILDAAEKKERRFGPEEIIEEMTTRSGALQGGRPTSLWEETLRQLDLPRQVPYTEGGDRYPVRYTFDIDRCAFESSFGEKGAFGESSALQVEVHVERLLSGEERPQTEHGDAFLWKLPSDGRTALQEDLKEWAALSAACREHHTPPTIKESLRRKGEDLPARIASRIQNGTLKVPEKDPESIASGVEQYVRKTTPSAFHPEMLLVDEKRLQKLEGTRWTSDLPPWARKIEVVCDGQSGRTGDIISTIRATVGRSIKQDGPLSVKGAIGRLQEEESFYEDVEPALVAHLWGLSKEGSFQPVSEEGKPLKAEELLDPTRWHEVRLRTGEKDSLRELLERIPPVEPIDTLNEAIVKARSFIDDQRRRATELREKVGSEKDEGVSTKPVEDLLKGLSDWLSQKRGQMNEWLKETKQENPNWEPVVEGTLKTKADIDKAESQWESRKSFLLQLDGLLLFSKRHGEDLKEGPRGKGPLGGERAEEVAGALSDLRQEARMGTSKLWWTEDGWTDLVDTLSRRRSAIQALNRWWEQIGQGEKRSQIAKKTEGHPWLVKPTDPSVSDVGSRFESRVLRPLRQFRQAMKQVGRATDLLTEEPHRIDTEDLRPPLKPLRRGRGLGLATLEDAEAMLQKLRLLEGITRGKEPRDVEAIGWWPEDANRLESELRGLAGGDKQKNSGGENGEAREGEKNYELKDTEHGVIVTKHS